MRDKEIDLVKALANDLADAREEKKSLEERLKKVNEAIKNIEEHSLSDALDNMGITKVQLDDMDISKSFAYRGACVKSNKKDAFDFLFDSDNEGALKQRLIIDLSVYPEMGSMLDEIGIEYSTEYSIHHATLGSIIKELVETGEFSTDDIEKYHVYVQPQIRVKRKIGEQRNGETE